MTSEFQAFFQNYSKSVLEKDLNLFSSLFSENVHAFDMWEKWSHEGITEWKGTAKDWFDSLQAESENCVVEFSEITEKHSGDLGYATAYVKFEAQTLKGETIRYMDNRLTWVFERRNDVWKVFHQHTSAPLDSSAKPMFQRK